MNALNILTGLYAKLNNVKGVPYWVLTPFRKTVRWTANVVLPHYFTRLRKKRTVSGKGIIVSFTSFPARIGNVWKVVECLKNQSVRPERIILWLSKEQFPNPDDVPQTLKDCEDALFELRMVDGDIRSHKKYYYAMQEFPDKSIVTCDDDVYYHRKMLQTLIETSLRYPNCIIANTSKQIVYDKNGNIEPYSKWDVTFKPYSSLNRVQIGIGGVLYPPNCLSELVLRKELFTELTPLADDLWLNMTARLNNTPVVQSGKDIFTLPIKSDAPSLKSVNTGSEKMNDRQINNMREWLLKEGYKDVYNINYQVGIFKT